MVIRLALALALLALPGTVMAYSGDPYKVCRLNPNGDNFLAFREGPSARSALILKLGPGADIEVRGPRENGRWFLAATVNRSGKFVYGYVFDAYVCPEAPPLISQ